MTKIFLHFFTFIVTGAVSASAFADTCDIGSSSMSTKDQPCAFCNELTCGTNSGYADNQTKLTAVKVQAFGSSGRTIYVTLPNPPGTLYDYASQDSDWVKSQLQARGIQNPNFFLQSVTTTETPKLYEDKDGKKLASASTSKANDNSIQCDAVEDPYIITTPSCGKKVCVMRVSCRNKQDGNSSNRTPARPCAIEAVNGQCPTATACANDNATTMTQTSVQLNNGLHFRSGVSSGSAQ